MDIAQPAKEERGQHNRARDGLPTTIGALRMRQVGTLLIRAAFDRSGRVWCGPEATHLALACEEHVDLGIDDPPEAATAHALIRAGVGSAAEISFVPGDLDHAPAEGVGALPRSVTP